jgi:hypothetical protein
VNVVILPFSKKKKNYKREKEYIVGNRGASATPLHQWLKKEKN